LLDLQTHILQPADELVKPLDCQLCIAFFLDSLIADS